MLKIKTIVEIAGFPKEFVGETMHKVINNLKSNEKIKIHKIELAEVAEIKQLFSTFADMELEFKEIPDFLTFCYDYLPSSVELMEPESLELPAKDFDDMFNDVLARLHQYDLVLRNINAENIRMKNELKPKEP
ncbi:MAG TPA: hypothetical protein VJJ23_03230 [Candidatus Nanoarchaeia archaeon]|nr:hypothetical protein [Candidatus Nanoarchaeia archaeon]